jgi:hypothetical protein
MEKEKQEDFFDGIKEIARQISELQAIAVVQYTPLVENIIKEKICNEKQIEHTLDGLLDFACHPEGLKLFKKLCRYYYFINSQAAAEYVMIYKEMWDSDSSN